MSQTIEVVIPVHDPARPVERGIRSVLEQSAELAQLGVELRVTIICHNISVAEISDSVSASLTTDDAVSWLEHADGTKSPAGPRNAALAQSSATFLSFLDSDDYLEPGSLAGWWRAARDHEAAAVIAPLRTPEGVILRSPRIRSNKPAILDPVRDGLAYRSVPYGLLRRTSLLECGFRYAEGISIGEDLETTLKLWFRGGRIVYPYGSPAYHQTNDSGPHRVTSSLRPLAEEFRWLDALVQAPWLEDATLAERRSIALKLMRIHGIGALLRRGSRTSTSTDIGTDDAVWWSAADHVAWAASRGQLQALAGGALPALSRRDAALSQAATEAVDEFDLRNAVVRYSQAGRFGDLVTARPLALATADSVLRHYVNERRRTKSGVFTLR